MRYSMLVHLTKMARTLQEAAAYIDTAPDGDSLCPELLSNGVKMLEQIRMTVEQYRDDLHDPVLLEHLAAAEALWEVGGDALQGAIEAFAQSLPKAVRYQVRAVFFTGLGSTWDAMQSVYEYMRDDPRFDPVVVLIPVFRQVQQNGQVRQEVTYKDYLTPLGIPFLGHEQYRIEDDCPDLAFTNQPYESVIPEEFWPVNIVKHTRLVYLPYFLPFLILEEHKQTLCQLPVYRYAWKVIGASDRHYRFYRKYALNGGSNMLVTGLPKLDPIVQLQNQRTDIPLGWETAIKGRKAFLWNTWYDYQSSSITYFNTIIRWFQTHNDCTLIWRPHPMTDTVTKLYYPPDIYTQLQRNIETVQKMPNAIYDNEASCNAAFACSIAQISDYSSLMCQYLPLDKPLLWTKSNMRDGMFSKQQGAFFIDWKWMEEASNADDVLLFLSRIRQGIDLRADMRQAVLKQDIPLADGQCGERVCKNLWDTMHNEDFF